MDRKRLIIALALSLLILMGWPLVMHKFFPAPTPDPSQIEVNLPPAESPAQPTNPAASPQTASTPKPGTTSKPGVTPKPGATPQSATTRRAVAPSGPLTLTTEVAQREIVIETPYWQVTLTNRGAVATSWILRTDAKGRPISAASGGPLELVPQNVLDTLGAPLALRLPWSHAFTDQLSKVNFQIEGIEPTAHNLVIKEGEQRQITFIYSTSTLVARKTFKFYGDRFVFDASAEVKSGGSDQPVEIVIGPRIGDQTDKQAGSYSTPPQVIAYTRGGDRVSVLGPRITPPFAKITGIDAGANRIEIDKPLAEDVDRIKILTGDGKIFLGYAMVTSREMGSRVLTLDSLPQGAAPGSNVAQGADTLRQGYRWVGLVDHYFAMTALSPTTIDSITLTNIPLKTDGSDTPTDYPSIAVPVRPDSFLEIFVGPKQRELLAQVGKEFGTDLGALIDYGMFAFMIRPLVPIIGWALDSLGSLFGNYGWAIVVVTAIINLTLSPLRWYSSKKMKKAAKHQPRMKELQERMKKLKENPAKYKRELEELQKEQMELMKEANPLGGCLPLLLQMPIFWAFFVYLTISLDVRHAPWMLWLKDLSTPDPYHVLPILMCVTMIASTALTPQPASADSSMKMQRIMMTWLMPILLTYFFFFSAPSGLVLYWMVSNVVGVLIQVIINKKTAEPAPQSPAALAGAGGKGGASRSQTTKAGKKAEALQKRKASDKGIIEGVK
jgi:YidC/Oxa1 family membrane protein insertase